MEIISEESTRQTPEKITIKFLGQGSRYFGIAILNAILTIITLGLYYPWAKANIRKFLWNETEVKDSRMVFHGTGKEMFRGFIIAYLVLGSLYLGMVLTQSDPEYALYFALGFYLGLILIVPLAIFGAWRYRITRTSWRGIFMGFDGVFKKFLKLYFKHLFFTIISFGIYAPWFRVEIITFLFNHTLIGKNRLGFKGQGSDLFGINLLGGILSVITLYLYVPVYLKDRINFTLNNTFIDNGDTQRLVKSHLTGKQAWVIMVTNVLLVIVTLGIGFAWASMRYMRMILENIDLPDNLDLDNLEQSEKGRIDATGDELVDIMDVGIDF